MVLLLLDRQQGIIGSCPLIAHTARPATVLPPLPWLDSDRLEKEAAGEMSRAPVTPRGTTKGKFGSYLSSLAANSI